MSFKLAACALTFMTVPGPPVEAHDIYSHLVDAWGKSCCDNRDCRPAPYRYTARRLQMFVDRRWIDVPEEAVQYRSLPGDTGETRGGHWCGSAYEPNGTDPGASYVTRCAILPPSNADAASLRR